MSSPAIIPEMRVHCDDSQAEQNTASFPASANPVQCGGARWFSQQPRATAVPARSFAVGFGPPQTFIASQPADKSEICPMPLVRVISGALAGVEPQHFLDHNVFARRLVEICLLWQRLPSPSAFADLAKQILAVS